MTLCSSIQNTLLETAKVMQLQNILHTPLLEQDTEPTVQYLKVATQYSILGCADLYIPLQEYDAQAKKCLETLENSNQAQCDTTDWL